MIDWKSVKITIDISELAEVILDMVVGHHDLFNSIVLNKDWLFILKFWSSLYYFLKIKQRLSTTFHLQTNGQTEWQNSTIEAYFWAFINIK